LVGGLLPDPKIPIPVIAQNIIAYAVAFAMGMYFPYYFYRAFKLKKMKFYAYWGNLIFLLLPFLLLFITPYCITGDFGMSRKLAMIVPFFYTLSFLYSLREAIKDRNTDSNELGSKKDIIGMYIAVILFGILPLIGFFETNLNDWLRPILHFHNGSQVVEILITNSGLVVMALLFVRKTVRQAKDEYNQLINSKKQLQEMNSELTIKVKERTQELELANEQKVNVFINLAHETKTPLTLISNYLDEYIRKYGQTDNEDLRLLKKAIGNLTKDIVNFFDMEKILKGINLYNHNHISNFSELLSESVSLFKVLANRKKIEIQTKITENIFIKADPSALFRIINNLIENAIKYTPEGGKININLAVIANNITFLVRDTGIGIPSNMKSKVFEPYFQINSEKANFQGMGLGLSIVNKIIVELKGDIQIYSDSGVGTEIVVSLNAYEKSETDLVISFSDDTTFHFEVEKLNIPDKPFHPERATLMVVEDNVELLTYMVASLREKYNVFYAVNGIEAVEKLNQMKHLDLIISDVMMDNGDGFLLYKHVLSNTKIAHVPFIFLTAKITIDDRIEGLSMGAVDYICKPVSMEELNRKIESLLNNLLNQRNAIIRNAYNSLITNKQAESEDAVTTPTGTALTGFEYNCYKYKLSSREKDVVQLMAQGKINKEIGCALFISVDTVRKHIQNTYEKVGVTNKFELLKKLEC
jgi:signal transduction histidine kinase/DNA-binding NarL/FixJ family response regulator